MITIRWFDRVDGVHRLHTYAGDTRHDYDIAIHALSIRFPHIINSRVSWSVA